jgi:uncharacterized protein (DUF427 family)
MPKAIWNGMVIAESDDTEVVEGDHYFPADSVKQEFLKRSNTTSICPWKGTASYYHINVDGRVNSDAAFYYPDPKKAARHIKNRIAFWKGIQIDE